ncbi:MAG: hypothetical protein Q9190_002622 [Brigantiaea leucoxantha]
MEKRTHQSIASLTLSVSYLLAIDLPAPTALAIVGVHAKSLCLNSNIINISQPQLYNLCIVKVPFEPFMNPPSPENSPRFLNPRARRQLTLAFAGLTFTTLSLLTTRRALRRKYTSTIPPLFHPSNLPSPIRIDGRLEALEALTLATLNVTSISMFLAGGLMWAFDVVGMEEARERLREARKSKNEEKGGDEGVGEDKEVEGWMEQNFGKKEENKVNMRKQ